MVTRMPILACLLTLPVAFGPMRMSRRIVALVLVLCVGVAVFYMPTFQKKTFLREFRHHTGPEILQPELRHRGERVHVDRDGHWALDDLWLGKGTGAGETLGQADHTCRPSAQ